MSEWIPALFMFCMGVGFARAITQASKRQRMRRYPPGAERGFWVEQRGGVQIWIESPDGFPVSWWEDDGERK